MLQVRSDFKSASSSCYKSYESGWTLNAPHFHVRQTLNTPSCFECCLRLAISRGLRVLRGGSTCQQACGTLCAIRQVTLVEQPICCSNPRAAATSIVDCLFESIPRVHEPESRRGEGGEECSVVFLICTSFHFCVLAFLISWLVVVRPASHSI